MKAALAIISILLMKAKFCMTEYSTVACDLHHIKELTLYGLNKGVLNNLDRFDIYYKNSRELLQKVNIDSLVTEIRKQAGKGY